MKLYAIIGALMAVLIAAKLFGDWRFDSGWNAHAIEYANAIDEAKLEAVTQARTKWELGNRIGEAEIIIEERIVERVRNIERQIPIVIESVPVCARDVGADFVRLLNDQVSASAGRSDESATNPDSSGPPL